MDGRPSLLDDYKPYLHQRWNHGCTNVRRLHAELRDRGYRGGYGIIRDYVQPFRDLGAAPPAVRAPPKAREAGPMLGGATSHRRLGIGRPGHPGRVPDHRDLDQRPGVRLLGLVQLVSPVAVGALAVRQLVLENTISQIPPNTATAPIRRVG